MLEVFVPKVTVKAAPAEILCRCNDNTCLYHWKACPTCPCTITHGHCPCI